MNASMIILQIQNVYPNAKVTAQGESCNFTVTISDVGLNNMTKVKAQQQIYQLFKTQIKSGEIHALTINLN